MWFCTGNEWQFNQPKVRRMFSSIREAKILIPFFYQRLGDYAELARLDLITFRNEMIIALLASPVVAARFFLRQVEAVKAAYAAEPRSRV